MDETSTDIRRPKKHQIPLFDNDIVYINGTRCEENIVSLLYVLNTDKSESFEIIIRREGKSYLYVATDVLYALLYGRKICSPLGLLRAFASADTIRADNGISLLGIQYQDTKRFTNDKSPVSQFLFPHKKHKIERIVPLTKEEEQQLIFPLGCNRSQHTAVINAFNSQVSIIQGPPGTGKTLTIINFISNLILRGKTILVVSSNNEAVGNIKEWLERYNLGFIVAPLGRRDNVEAFIYTQPPLPEDIDTWALTEFQKEKALKEVENCHRALKKIYTLQEQYATALHHLNKIEVEWGHFREQYSLVKDDYKRPTLPTKEVEKMVVTVRTLKNILSTTRPIVWTPELLTHWQQVKQVIALWELQTPLEIENIHSLLIELQAICYCNTLNDDRQNVQDIKKELEYAHAEETQQRLMDNSMLLFKDTLQKYYEKHPRIFFDETMSVQKEGQKIVKQYPIISSTTFSATYSTPPDFLYDYVIMDEASQISIETGTLALSCAKRAVIVGDDMQLPNIVTDTEQKLRADVVAICDMKTEDIRNYQDGNFLESIVKVFHNSPNTFLREHYRSEPQIIEFCNEKFYDGQLLVMTESHPENKPLMVITTPPGEFSRYGEMRTNGSKFNEAEIEAIKEFFLPLYDASMTLGIISPYNAQVDLLKNHLGELEISTVHKFQGKERDCIVISCVNDQLDSFTDGTYITNVAISRAQKHLVIVMSGNKQLRKGILYELMQYIYYMNYQIEKNQEWAIMDYLNTRYITLNKHIANDTTYLFLKDILVRHKQYHILAITYHTFLREVLRSNKKIDEWMYVDFIIYNRITHLPLVFIDIATHPSDVSKEFLLGEHNFKLLRLTGIGEKDRENVCEALNRSTFFPKELCGEVSTPA